jgi:6-phosphofructokinase 1
MDDSVKYEKKIIEGDGGYVLEDVPHLTDYLDDLPVSNNFSFLSKYLLLLSIFVRFKWKKARNSTIQLCLILFHPF